ncbi:glycoside hydrolase family 9 protein [Hymenobacter fodinae]|uniref:Endoglucanase n=1 Tax=Hymenobacter fodinae TaxID=2510796 RepID=A0A4Z0P2I7_9BACT|nr:glycoside hydrolase family 9 protein [Hymenobacter fodinae]TGE05220.1 cellulase [Hymenobacter fodinae]
MLPHQFRLPLILGGLFLGLCTPPLLAQQATDSIRLNQLGFYPKAPKIAALVGAKPGTFTLTAPGSERALFTGTVGAKQHNPGTGEDVRLADFSAFTTPGTYVLRDAGGRVSYPFQIQRRVHEGVARAALKSYYYQRVSTALPALYAGRWSRPLGHPDTQVLVHASAATAQRPTGTLVSAPRGWYDAGDYNKYVVNSGITMGTLFSLYEDFPTYCRTFREEVPESSNRLPDVVDETLWNLRWMLAMQDPTDGGVYHKLTNAAFDGMEMPALTTKPRYVVQKSTAAALDFAAITAQASRILKQFPRQLPGLADSCLQASVRAWQWAQAHPQVLYRQADINKQVDPDISTGEYGDQDLHDEWVWAAAELYVTTSQPQYYQVLQPALAESAKLPSWNQVQALGYYTLARFRSQLPAAAQAQWPTVRKHILALADELRAGYEQQPYQTAMTKSAANFVWGSNATAANQGVALIQAYRLSGDKQYLQCALANLDYLLGRNATGYCFVTGFGSKAPQHPHHRLSEADGIAEPLPGFLVGGPNPGRQDGCQYLFSDAERAYTDEVCSYASNEVAINWNAPLVYLTVAMEALQNDAGFAK